MKTKTFKTFKEASTAAKTLAKKTNKAVSLIRCDAGYTIK